MGEHITKNLDYLCRNITNLTEILIYLITDGTISHNESDEIKAEKTPLGQNFKLLSIMERKDWNRVGNLFLEILRKTNNQHCADKIEGISNSSQGRYNLTHPKIRKRWWPDKKLVTKSLHKRKFGCRFLVEELHDRILKDENQMVVLCESADAAKYSGLGGVGKTLTAKWYAQTYEDEYVHILWIDCGEGSLVHSFKSLARDLQIHDRNELVYIEEFARKCFDCLSEFKCLWIYDNAESYKGKEGIQNVLPQEEKNFFCLITSRSREWGVKNIGYGKISDLELDIFSEDESVQFLRQKLDEEITCSDLELSDLSRLLGNLPMALELALATLNTKKMEVKKYLKKLREKDLRVLDTSFDKYEEKINKNINIFIEEILEDDEGKLAIEILKVFGYIRPDDIPQQFIEKIFNSQVHKSIDLLVRYCLISKEMKNGENYFLGIHRLLQQVIRHNGRETETETLTTILGCEGFVDLKLIPFTKYADDYLRKKFPELKSQLLDQQQLTKLLMEKRFDECVQLAYFINQELQRDTTKFNYGICMYENGQLEECVKILEGLYKEELEEEKEYYSDDVELGLLRLRRKEAYQYGYRYHVYRRPVLPSVSRELVGGHLLLAYFKTDNKQKRKEILKTRIQFKIIISKENLGVVIELVNSDFIDCNYSVTKQQHSFIDLKVDVETKKIELNSCSLSLSCFDRLSPGELTLEKVSFIRHGQQLKDVKVNDFVDLTAMKGLTLKCDEYKKNMSLDLNGDVSMEYLHLDNARVLNWNNSNWNVKELELKYIPFVEKTNIKLQKMTIHNSSLDFSCLPRTVQKLSLNRVKEFVSGKVEVPKLNYLTLEGMYDVDCLSHFESAPLSHLQIDWIKELNVDILPQTLTHLKITNNSDIRVVGGVRKVNKLILEGFNFKEMEEWLSRLQTDNLVIYSSIKPKQLVELINRKINTIAAGKTNWDMEHFKNYLQTDNLEIHNDCSEARSLTPLINMQIMKIAAGKMNWKSNPYSSQFDRQADYYFLKGGRGRGIDEDEFKKLCDLHGDCLPREEGEVAESGLAASGGNL